MKELGVVVLGDRLVFLEYLKLLKKHKRDADRSKSLWSGTTPVPKLPYHKNCGQFCFHVSSVELVEAQWIVVNLFVLLLTCFCCC